VAKLRIGHRYPSVLAIAAVSIGVVLLAARADSSASPLISKQDQIVTPRGIGHLRIGTTVSSLHRHHLIRGLRPGCELDPGQRVARLRPPLKGFAIFADGKNRLSSLSITGGAETAKHIGIGSTPKEARAAYPRALYNPPGTFDPFAEGFFWINGIRHPKMTFVVDPGSNEISAIDVPAPSFCE